MYLNVNGVRYAVHTSGEGQPLVMLHGFSGSSADWSPFVPFFAQHFRVITLDMLGHGETDSPTDPMRYAVKHIRRDLTCIVEDLCDQSAHLLGYSMGGRMALILALHHSKLFRSLILESASPGIALEEERIDRKERDDNLAERIEQLGMEAFVEEWEALPLWDTQRTLPTETLQRQREIRLSNNPVGLANSLRGYGAGAQPSEWDNLHTLKMPVLLITGALDAKFTHIARQMAAQIPYANQVIVPQVGHNVHLENPRAYAHHVLEFLQGLAQMNAP
jgi:2-succinyl-6-hydroxy-2,4-cyclohexadiene-1-carboxylate synthase